MGDPFSSLSEAEHFGDLAFVCHYDGAAGLAEGFAEAAEAIFSAWQDQEWPNDRLISRLWVLPLRRSRAG